MKLLHGHDVVRAELNDWTQTKLGQSLAQEEECRLQQVLAKLYGPTAIQFGVLGLHRYIRSSSAVYHVHAVDPPNNSKFSVPVSAMYATAEAMPLEAKTVSVLLLPHVLEFSHDPHQILREASRVLVPEGHLVLVCFNPFSPWGIRRALSGFIGDGQAAPWHGRYFGLSRVKDWISVLGFEFISGSAAYYLPPFKSAKIRERLSFLQKMGPRWWPMWSAVFILVARKREAGMTPIAPWRRKKQRLAPGLAEPITKNG